MIKKLKLYLNFLTWAIAHIIPKKKDRWVFGAWFGSRISDNSYALYRYIRANRPEVEAIWICNDPDMARRMGIDRALKRNSMKAKWACLRAEVSVMNQGYLDFGDLNWISGSYRVQLWHGVPWKKIGEDAPDGKSGLLHRVSHGVFLFACRYDMYIAPSKACGTSLQSAFLTDEDSILYVGQPRNEVLFDEAHRAEARQKLIGDLGLNCERLIIYMPTFRDKTETEFSFFSIADRVAGTLEQYNAVILEKQHYVNSMRGEAGARASERIRNVNALDSQDLLAAADILITDYSSCFFDFLICDKPIIHYLYDYDYYRDDDRGLYYDKDDVAAGAVAETEDALLAEIEAALADGARGKERRAMISERFITFESPRNSQLIAAHIEEALLKKRRRNHGKESAAE